MTRIVFLTFNLKSIQTRLRKCTFGNIAFRDRGEGEKKKRDVCEEKKRRDREREQTIKHLFQSWSPESAFKEYKCASDLKQT